MDQCYGDFINLETPRIRKFYDHHAQKDYAAITPINCPTTVLNLMTSPKDEQAFSTFRNICNRQQDTITHYLDNTSSAGRPRTTHGGRSLMMHLSIQQQKQTTSPRDVAEELFNGCSKYRKHLTFMEEEELSALDTRKKSCGKENYLHSPCTKHRGPLRDITARINNTECSDSDEKDGISASQRDMMEIRKRKRKSNHQLKILKWEFDRDGFWSKDKILNVAKLTGLSESQVYKWCWDQKKKKESGDGRPEEPKNEDRDLGSRGNHHNKENDSPLMKYSQLSRHSKQIFKGLNPTRLAGGHTRRSGLKKGYSTHFRFESNIPKRIDFSLERM